MIRIQWGLKNRTRKTERHPNTKHFAAQIENVPFLNGTI